jgi:hypothetical protein
LLENTADAGATTEFSPDAGIHEGGVLGSNCAPSLLNSTTFDPIPRLTALAILYDAVSAQGLSERRAELSMMRQSCYRLLDTFRKYIADRPSPATGITGERRRG